MFSLHRPSIRPRALGAAGFGTARFGVAVVLALAVLGVSQVTATDRAPDLVRALAEQQALVNADPGDAVARNDLGNLLELDSRYEEAEAAYRSALDLDPRLVSARFNLGLLLMQRMDFVAASETFQAVVDIDPGHAWAYYQLGVLAERRGERQRAIDRYARAFGLDPALSFAEVNPHVIDNELVTQSLLEAQRYLDRGATKVPRQYGDRVRIAALMLGVESSPDAESLDEVVSDAQAAEDLEADAESDGYANGQYRDDDDYEDDSARRAADELDRSSVDSLAVDRRDRVLTTDDLDSSDRTGEVVGGGAAAPNRRPGSVFNRYRRPTNNRDSATRDRTPTTRNRANTGATGNQGSRGTVDRGRVTTRGGTAGREVDRQEQQERQRLQRFRPTRRSSAQLELVLETEVTETR